MTPQDAIGNPDPQRLREVSGLLSRLAEVLEAQDQLANERAGLEASINELGAGSGICPAGPPRPAPLQHNGSNASLYIGILKEHGRPMHARDITAIALERGLTLAGKMEKNPAKKVRHALSRCERVYNLGSNIWWLLGEPEP